MLYSGGMAGGTNQNSLVKSIQEVEITIAAGSTSGTASLSPSVDKNKSIIPYHGTRVANSSNDGAALDCRVELTSGSTVTAYVNSTHTSARVVRAVVKEYYPWVIEGTVKHFTVTISSGNLTGTGGVGSFLTSANVGRDGMVYLGNTNDNTGDAARINKRFAHLTGTINSGSISAVAARGSTTGNMVVGVCQWVYARGVLDGNRQIVELTIPAGQTSVLDSFPSALDLTNTLCLSMGQSYTDGFTTGQMYAFQGSGSQVLGIRTGTSGTAIMRVAGYRFLSKWVKGGKQQALITFTAGSATKDHTFTTFNPSKTLLSYLGHTGANAFSDVNYMMPTIKTKDSDEVRLERGTGVDFGNVPTVSVEAFEFV